MSEAAQWEQSKALQFARIVHAISPTYGLHVALTGGCLYSYGPRKDADFVLYRVRQCETPDLEGLFVALESVGVRRVSDHGFVVKAKWVNAFGDEYPIDFLMPDRPVTVGAYPNGQ